MKISGRSTRIFLREIFLYPLFASVVGIAAAAAQEIPEVRDAILHNCDKAKQFYTRADSEQVVKWTELLGEILKLDLASSPSQVANQPVSIQLKINDSAPSKVEPSRFDSISLIGVEEQMQARRCAISILNSFNVDYIQILPAIIDFSARLELDDELRFNVDQVLLRALRRLSPEVVSDQIISEFLKRLAGNRPSVAKDFIWAAALLKPDRVVEIVFTDTNLSDLDSIRLLSRLDISPALFSRLVLKFLSSKEEVHVKRALLLLLHSQRGSVEAFDYNSITPLFPELFAFNNREVLELLFKVLFVSKLELNVAPPFVHPSAEQIDLIRALSFSKANQQVSTVAGAVLRGLARSGAIDEKQILAWLSDSDTERRIAGSSISLIVPPSFKATREYGEKVILTGELPEVLGMVSVMAQEVRDESSAKVLLRIVKGLLATRGEREQGEILRAALEETPGPPLFGPQKVWADLIERYLSLPPNAFVDSIRDRAEVNTTIAKTLLKLGDTAVPILKRMLDKAPREAIAQRALLALGDRYSEDSTVGSYLVSKLGISGSVARATILKLLLGRSGLPQKALKEASRSTKDDRKFMASVILWSLGERGKELIPSIKSWLDRSTCDEFWHGVQPGFFSEASLQSTTETRLSECFVARDGFSFQEFERVAAMPEVSTRVLNSLLQMNISSNEVPRARAIPIIRYAQPRGVDSGVVDAYYLTLLNSNSVEELEATLSYNSIQSPSPELLGRLRSVSMDDSNSLQLRCVAYGFLSRVPNSEMDWEEAIREMVKSDTLARCLSQLNPDLVSQTLINILPSEPKRRIATILRTVREQFPSKVVLIGIEGLRSYSTDMNPKIRNEGIWGLLRAILLAPDEQGRLLDSLYFESGELAQEVLGDPAYRDSIATLRAKVADGALAVEPTILTEGSQSDHRSKSIESRTRDVDSDGPLIENRPARLSTQDSLRPITPEFDRSNAGSSGSEMEGQKKIEQETKKPDATAPATMPPETSRVNFDLAKIDRIIGR